MTISPLARPFPDLPEIPGVRRGVATAGYKPWTRADVTLLAFDEHPPGGVGGAIGRRSGATRRAPLSRRPGQSARSISGLSSAP